MSRYAFGLLLFSIAALTVVQFNDTAPVLHAQVKKKKKDKDNPKIGTPGAVAEDYSRVLPVFDPGSHTQPISAMGFTKDKSKLITVGQDFSVQVWSTGTGERLDILRLPGYGREKGYDPGRWDVAAVSADGTRVAIGGQVKYLNDLNDDNSARLMIVDLAKRTVNRVMLRTGRNRPVTALAFSRNGEALAIGIEKGPKEDAVMIVVNDLTNRLKSARPGVQTQDCQQVAMSSTPTRFAFSPAGDKLLAGGADARVTLWDLPAAVALKPTLAKEANGEGSTNSLDWSPDGKQFIRATHGGNGTNLNGIELWNTDGTRARVWKLADLRTVIPRYGHVDTIHFRDANTAYFVGNGFVEKGEGSGTFSGLLDLAKGGSIKLTANSDGMVLHPVAAITADGELVATTVAGSTQAVIGQPKPGAVLVRCGGVSQHPFQVGWTKDPAKPGFAWAYERRFAKDRPSADLLRFGFDLSKVEPVGAIRNTDYDPSRLKVGDWTLEFGFGKGAKSDDAGSKGQLKQNGKTITGFPMVPGKGKTLIPSGDNAPLVAFAVPRNASLFKGDGTRITRLLPDNENVLDMASSPDGRYLICTTGTPRLVVYRTDGSPYPFFSFAQLNGEWVLWTPEGYYAASPGGEKLFGWAVTTKPNALVTFHPAEKYAKQFRRPDVIKLAIEKGSLELALKELKANPVDIEKTVLPPVAELKIIKQTGMNVAVRARAESADKQNPVVAMRLLLDGRPLPDGRGVVKVEAGKPAEADWEIQVPGGSHELKLLARSDAGSAVSDPLVVIGPKTPGQQPNLYRLCVGVNDYDDAGLKLNAAAKDAADVFAAFEKDCAGTYNRFGSARGQLLLNKEATRDAVLKAIAAIRKAARPGDLFVLFFAGHGVKQDAEFYLLTREADTGKSLKGFSLSGEDLRKALSDIECPVLLIMDACHSAKGIKAFRPATDDLTRTLTDDSAGVTVMAAAMAHEVANANAENGYFTAAFLKALKAEEGVPFDPYERALYTHHIYSVVFAEVRRASNGKQNPFLNAPWTVPPLAIRDVSR